VRSPDGRHAGGPWPSPAQELLLRAATLSGDASAEAWRAWRADHDLDSADQASQRVFPLLYRRLRNQGVDDPLLGRLKGTYRLTWVWNQMLFTRASQALAALASSGIDAIVLKGASLALLDYRDAGARPMGDVDFLIRPRQVGPAVGILKGLEWTPRIASTELLVEVLHGDSFQAGEGPGGLDLHWQGLMRRHHDEDLWQTVVPLDLRGFETRALDPVGRLMHVCVHAVESGPPPLIQWIPDALAILRNQRLDWEELVERSRGRQVTLIMARMLGHLRERDWADVPEAVVRRLEQSPRSRFEQAAYAAAVRPRSIRNVLRLEWFRYRRLDPEGRRSPRGFGRYLQFSLGYARRRDLARHAFLRLVRGPINP
jgi:hypothetical protein